MRLCSLSERLPLDAVDTDNRKPLLRFFFWVGSGGSALKVKEREEGVGNQKVRKRLRKRLFIGQEGGERMEKCVVSPLGFFLLHPMYM